MLKKFTMHAGMFLLFFSMSVSAEEIHEDYSSWDIDDLTPVECTLRPIERKSRNNAKHELHAPLKSSHSLNWCGYASVTGKKNLLNPTYGSVTEARGKWNVPTAVPNPEGDTYSATYVGIDGFVSPTVEQIGTEQDVIDGIPQYYAWFELYPGPSQVIDGFSINPGDVIEGKVRYLGSEDGNDLFRLTIKNLTQKIKFSIVQQTLPGTPAHRSSAEWIVESPAILVNGLLAFLPLTDFDKITFNKCKTEIDGRCLSSADPHSGSINDKRWTFDKITMVTQEGVIKAAPSKLSKDGESFSVIWNNSGIFPFEILLN